MSKLISRDSFAREELHSERLNISDYSWSNCDFCGSVNNTKTGKKYLYKYFILPDDSNRKNYIQGNFCCVDCMRSYHS